MIQFEYLDNDLVDQIADRIKKTYPVNRMTLGMDLAAVNATSPIDAEKLLAFNDFDFFHDIGGIASNLDRRTGKLNGFFTPRCSSVA